MQQFAIVPSSWRSTDFLNSLMMRVCYVTFCVYRKPTPAYKLRKALA